MFWNSSSGAITLEFSSKDQVNSMFHSGDCEGSVLSELPYFLPQLAKYTPSDIEAVLLESGFDEVNIGDVQDLQVKLLWIAAGDLYDVIEEADE